MGGMLVATDAAGGHVRAYTLASDGSLGVGSTISSGGTASTNGISFSKEGQHAYVTYAFNTSAGAWNVDLGHHTMTPMSSPVSTSGGTPTNLAIDPMGRFVYANSTAGDIATTFSLSNFDLSSTTGNALGGSATARWVAAHPDGNHVFYATGQGVRSFSVDSTGTLHPITTLQTSTVFNSVAVDPSGSWLCATDNSGNISTYRIGQDGSLTPGASVNIGPATFEISFAQVLQP